MISREENCMICVCPPRVTTAKCNRKKMQLTGRRLLRVGGKGKNIKKKCPLAKISLIVSRLDFNGVVPAHIRGDFD